MEREYLTKSQQNINGFPVQFISFEDDNGSPHYAITEIENEQGQTPASLELLEAVRNEFHEFKIATVRKKGGYLILTDYFENELHLTGCSCGYPGTGPHGTLKVLNDLGFEINRRFVFSSTSFELMHPTICKYYSLDIEEPVTGSKTHT